MNGPTVNIADFRCRAISARSANAPIRFPLEPSIVEFNAREAKTAVATRRDAILREEDSGVYNIESARETQRLRQRGPVRSVSIQRRAKVLHFSGDVPPQTRANAHKPGSPVLRDPSDLPPAA